MVLRKLRNQSVRAKNPLRDQSDSCPRYTRHEPPIESSDPHLRGSVSIDDSAPVRCNVHAAKAVRIASYDVAGVVPLMRIVVDLSPGSAAVCGSIVSANAAYLSGQEDGWVGRTGCGLSETNAIGQYDVRELRKANSAVRRVPHAACRRVRTHQPNVVGFVVHRHNFRSGGQPGADSDGEGRPIGADIEDTIRKPIEFVGSDTVRTDTRLPRQAG